MKTNDIGQGIKSRRTSTRERKKRIKGLPIASGTGAGVESMPRTLPASVAAGIVPAGAAIHSNKEAVSATSASGISAGERHSLPDFSRAPHLGQVAPSAFAANHDMSTSGCRDNDVNSRENSMLCSSSLPNLASSSISLRSEAITSPLGGTTFDTDTRSALCGVQSIGNGFDHFHAHNQQRTMISSNNAQAQCGPGLQELRVAVNVLLQWLGGKPVSGEVPLPLIHGPELTVLIKLARSLGMPTDEPEAIEKCSSAKAIPVRR